MKLTYIKIDNFREVRSIDLRDLNDNTILVGPNGAGKSTVLDAVRVCLAGQCYDQTGKRIPNEDLIGPHGKNATIDLGVEVAGKSFSLFLTIKKNGTALTAKDARAYEAFPGADSATTIRAALCEAMRTDLARIECAVNPRAYLLGPELGNMLAELCAGTVDLDQVRLAAGDHWEYLAQLGCEACIDWDIAGFAKIGDAAYKRRTEVKKRLAVAQQTIADRESTEQPRDTKGNPMEPDKLQPLTKLLDDLQAQRDALIAERGRVEAVLAMEAESEQQRNQLKAAILKAESDVAAATKAIEVHSLSHGENEVTAKRAAEFLAQVDKMHKEVKGRVESATKALAALEGENGACPTCGRAYTAKLRESLLGPLQSELGSATGDLARINYEDAKSKCAHYHAQAEASGLLLSESRNILRDAQAELTRFQRDLAALVNVSGLPTVDELTERITALESRIKDGTAKVDALSRWAELTSAQENAATLESEIQHLEWAIMAFRDGEYLKSHLSDYKGEFEGRCNAVLAPYGYTLGVDVDGKHVEVTLAKEGHRAAPLAQCSKAELVLAGWAVATAFAGESLICLDDMDALYGKTKNILLKSLTTREAGTPVIVAGAWTAPSVDLDPIRTALPAASVVWVENGEAKTQGARVAA